MVTIKGTQESKSTPDVSPYFKVKEIYERIRSGRSHELDVPFISTLLRDE